MLNSEVGHKSFDIHISIIYPLGACNKRFKNGHIIFRAKRCIVIH